VTLVNVTITGNSARTGGGIFHQAGGGTAIKNTIIAQNLVAVTGAGPDVSGAFISQGHNLIGDAAGNTDFTGAGDQVGDSVNPIDPLLGPLASNGGRTQTHALLGRSPALNKGDNNAIDPTTFQPLTTDQRGAGFPRKKGAFVDIGAFEK
jgi:hypothetical protein